LKSRNVEIRTCKDTKDVSALTKAADFVKAFILGFQVEVSDFVIPKIRLEKENIQCGCFNGLVPFQSIKSYSTSL
jgi:rRNA processing protein Krr1/Pno1